MRTLIVGGSSLVGTTLAAGRFDLGDMVTAGRTGADIPFDLRNDHPPDTGDLRVDTVILTAADFGGPSDDDLSRATRANVSGSITACRLALQLAAKHVVLVSSVSATYEAGDDYYGSYSLTKRQSEDSVAFFCNERGLRLTTLRPTALYDTSGWGRQHQRLLYAIVDNARSGGTFTFAGAADPERNFLHVDDFARVIELVVRGAVTGTYTCAHPRSHTLTEIAQLANDAFATGATHRFDATLPDIASLPHIERSDIYERISFTPQIGLASGFELMRDASSQDVSS